MSTAYTDYVKGGNGELLTQTVNVVGGQTYSIVVGAGGGKNTNGGSSSALGVTAYGGYGATNSSSGAGANYGNGNGGAGSNSGTGASGWVTINYTKPELAKYVIKL